MNLPNQLTLLRILLIPVCLLLWALELPVWAAAMFALAAATDFFDGYIARKQHIVTVFGKFADPVADKILVLTAMIFLAAGGRIPAWAVCVVAARELMVDGLRLVAVGKGNVRSVLSGHPSMRREGQTAGKESARMISRRAESRMGKIARPTNRA